MTDWFEGIEGETLGHLQNRGWDKMEAPAAAKAIYEAYRSAESRLGAPPEQILRLPKDVNDEAGWRQVYTRLGVPEKAEDYKFDGVSLEPPALDAFRATAAAAKMTPDQAKAAAATAAKLAADAKSAADATTTAAMQTAREALEKSWGPAADNRFKANLHTAEVAVQAAGADLGWDEATQARVKDMLAKEPWMLPMMHMFGAKMGEPNFVAGAAGTGRDGVMTAEQALSRWHEAQADETWRKNYLSNPGGAERREFAALQQINPTVGTPATMRFIPRRVA